MAQPQSFWYWDGKIKKNWCKGLDSFSVRYKMLMMSVKQSIITTSMLPKEPRTKKVFSDIFVHISLSFILNARNSTGGLVPMFLIQLQSFPETSLHFTWCSKCLNAAHLIFDGDVAWGCQRRCVAGSAMQHHRWSRGSFGHCEWVCFSETFRTCWTWVGRVAVAVMSVRILGWLNVAYHSFTWTISMLESFFRYFHQKFDFNGCRNHNIQTFLGMFLTWYLAAWPCLQSLWSALLQRAKSQMAILIGNVAGATHRCFWESSIVHSNILGIPSALYKRTFAWRHAGKLFQHRPQVA